MEDVRVSNNADQVSLPAEVSLQEINAVESEFKKIVNLQSSEASENSSSQLQQQIVETPRVQVKSMSTIVKISLFFWYLFTSFCSKIYSRQKVIRNQFVLITGSGGYLGRQIACELSKHGVSLVLWDVNEEENQKTYAALRALGHRRVYLYKVDLTNEAEVRDCAKRCKEKHGFIHMIVLAASTDYDLKAIFETTHTNSESPHQHGIIKSFKLFYESNLWLYQEFVPQMIEKNQGHLVLLTNEAVLANVPLMSAYSSLKDAQIKLLEELEEEISCINGTKNQVKYSIVYLGKLKNGENTTIMSKKFEKLLNLSKEASVVQQEPREITTNHTAKEIIKNVLKNKYHIYIPTRLYFITILKSLLPVKCFNLFYSYRNTQFIQNSFRYAIHKKND